MYENIEKYIYFRLCYNELFHIFLRSNMLFSRVNTTFFYVNRRIVSRSAPKYKRFKLLHKLNGLLHFGVAGPTNFTLSIFQLQTQIMVLQKKAKFKLKLFRRQLFSVLVQKLYYFQKSKYHSLYQGVFCGVVVISNRFLNI